MAKKISILFVVLIVAAISLSSCNFPLFVQQNPSVQTSLPIEAIVALTLTGQPPVISIATQTSTIQQAAPTYTQQPTLTPQRTYTPYPTATEIPCNQATFVDDITVEDDTVFSPGATIVKTWRLRNSGSCTWTTGYRIVFQSGDQMGASNSYAMPSSVAPGTTVDITISMVAPSSPGVYRGNWVLQNASGQTFGLGTSASPFYIRINVSSPTFAISHVDISLEHTHIEHSCPSSVSIHAAADITVTAPGTITYRWEFSDGYTSSWQTLTFATAGTQTVLYNRSFSTAFNGWINLYNDVPNHQSFGQVNFDIVCTP